MLLNTSVHVSDPELLSDLIERCVQRFLPVHEDSLQTLPELSKPGPKMQESAAEVSDEEDDEDDSDEGEAGDQEWDPSLATPAAGRRRRARSNSHESTVSTTL